MDTFETMLMKGYGLTLLKVIKDVNYNFQSQKITTTSTSFPIQIQMQILNEHLGKKHDDTDLPRTLSEHVRCHQSQQC